MGLFSDLFGSNKNTTSLVPMLTDQQEKAQNLLLDYAQTGRLPSGYQAGEAYNLSNFDFSPSSQERAGTTLLNRFIDPTRTREGIDTARTALTKLANVEFNPDDPSSGYAAYSRQVRKAVNDADNILNREAAITGSGYGSRIIWEKADLAAQQSDMLATKLADLYTQGQNRAIQAAQGLTNLESIDQGLEANALNAAFDYGTRMRDLKNQQAQLEYQDKQRQRDEQLQTITGAQNLYNKNVDFGLKSITKERPSTFLSMLGEFSPVVGSYNTHKYGYDTNQSSVSDAIKVLMELYSPTTGGV